MLDFAFKYLSDDLDFFHLPVLPSNEGKPEENKKRIQISTVVSSLRFNALDELALNLGLYEKAYLEHAMCRESIRQGQHSNLAYCTRLLKLTTLFANSFLISVDKYFKILNSLKEEFPELNDIVHDIYLALDTQIPNIKHLRNSALHVEQRLYRQKKISRKKEEINLHPDNTEGFMIAMQYGNTLKYTTQTSENVGIEISKKTMDIIVQSYLDLKKSLKEKYIDQLPE